MLKLVPVIEFAPGSFKSKDREIPSGDTAQDWADYWRNSLADSGILGINPYEGEGSWFVEVSQLTPEIVEILLNKQYESSIESGDFYSLAGGYVLEEDAQFLATPHCCGSIRDITEWEEASNWTNTDEMYLWIGHPQLMVSSIDSQNLRVRETYEYNAPEEAVIFTVDRARLKTAIIDAKKQLDNFEKVLAIAVAISCPHLVDNASEIVKNLICS